MTLITGGHWETELTMASMMLLRYVCRIPTLLSLTSASDAEPLNEIRLQRERISIILHKKWSLFRNKRLFSILILASDLKAPLEGACLLWAVNGNSHWSDWLTSLHMKWALHYISLMLQWAGLKVWWCRSRRWSDSAEAGFRHTMMS